MVPFASAWMGEHHVETVPVALYGVVLLMNAVAFTLLSRMMVRHEGAESTLARALGPDLKSKLSMVIYAVAIAAAFFQPAVSLLLYAVVALMWIVPDRRIERVAS